MYLQLFSTIVTTPKYKDHILEEFKTRGNSSQEFLEGLLQFKIPTKSDYSKLNK